MFKILGLVIVFTFLLTGCSSFLKTASTFDMKIKRSWVRRLIPENKLTQNKIAQNFSPIVRENGNVIQGSSYGGIFEFNKYGKKLWSVDVPDGVSGSGQLKGHFLFYGSLNKNLHCYDTLKKEELWSVSLDGELSSLSKVSNGKIFALTDEGSLYSLSTSDGAINWKTNQPSRAKLKIYGAPEPLIYKNQVIASFPNGLVTSLSQETGKSKWYKTFKGTADFSDADFLKLSPRGDLFVGSFDEAVYQLNPNTGNIKWQAFEKPVGDFSFIENKVFFSSGEGDLVALEASSGSVFFKKKVFKGVGGVVVFREGKLISADSKGLLLVLDKSNGEVLSSYDFLSPANANLVAAKASNKFYMHTNQGHLYYLGLHSK